MSFLKGSSEEEENFMNINEMFAAVENQDTNKFLQGLQREEEVYRWIHYLLIHNTDETEHNIALLDYVTKELTDVDVYRLYSSLKDADWDKYLAHLTHFKGENYHGHSLEGWWPDRFLAFRIRAILAMLLDREKKIVYDSPPLLSEDNHRYFLYRELLVNLNTLRLYQICQKIQGSVGKRTIYLDFFTNALEHYIKNMPQNMQLCLCLIIPTLSGSAQGGMLSKGAHVIYIVFEKNVKINARIDNLGYGICDLAGNHLHVQRLNEHRIVEVHPYILEDFNTVSNDLKKYLYGILKIFIFDESNPSIDNIKYNLFQIYHRSKQGTISLGKDLWFPQQTVGNCTVAGFQIGVSNRLGQKNFETFSREEIVILSSIYKRKDTYDHADFILWKTNKINLPERVWVDIKQDYMQIINAETSNSILNRLSSQDIRFNFTFDNADPNRYYTEVDINRLIQNYTLEKSKFLALPAVKISELSAIIKNFRLEYLANHQEFQKITLIPINLEASQWILVIVNPLTGSGPINIKYIYPYSQDIYKSEFERIFGENFEENKINITKINYKENIDSHDLGPLLISVAKIIIDSGSYQTPKITLSIDDIRNARKEHAKILLQLQKNIVSVDSGSEMVLSTAELIRNWRFDNHQAKCLWINAPAGYGKSRLSGYLVEKNIYDENEKVLWIKLRHSGDIFLNEINSENIFKCLVDIFWKTNASSIVSKKFSNCPWWYYQSIINSFMYDKVTLIFDGFDELSSNEQQNFINFFKIIISDQRFDQLHLIITSRPQFCFNFDLLKEKIIVRHIAPLNAMAIDQYINCFFKDHQNSDIKNFLKAKPSWQKFMETPFNLEIFCNIYKDKETSNFMLTSVTNLYDQIVSSMLKNAFVRELKIASHLIPNLRVETVRGHYKKAILRMEKIAYGLLKHKKLRMEGDFASRNKIFDDINTIGFLQVNNTMMEYPHKTFCEFMCASYIVKNLNKINKQREIKDFIANNKYDPYFFKVWIFASGLLYNRKKKYLPIFWDILLEKPWDMTGKYQIPLLMNCLEESQFHESIPYKQELKKLLLDVWMSLKTTLSKEFYWHKHDDHFFPVFRNTPYLLTNILKDEFHSFLYGTDKKLELLKQLSYTALTDEEFDVLLQQVGQELSNLFYDANQSVSNASSNFAQRSLPFPSVSNQNTANIKQILSCLTVFANVEVPNSKVCFLISELQKWLRTLDYTKYYDIFLEFFNILAKYSLIIDSAYIELKYCINDLFIKNLISPQLPKATIYKFMHHALDQYLELKFNDIVKDEERRILVKRVFYDIFYSHNDSVYKYKQAPNNIEACLSLITMVKKINGFGPYETEIVNSIVQKTNSTYRFLYLPIYNLENRLKLLPLFESYLQDYSCTYADERVSLLNTAYQNGYFDIHSSSSLLPELFNKALSDRAYASVIPTARAIIKKIINGSNIEQFIHKNPDNVVISFFRLLFEKDLGENYLNDILVRSGIRYGIEKPYVICILDDLRSSRPYLFTRVVEYYSKYLESLQSTAAINTNMALRIENNYFSSYPIQDDNEILIKLIENILALDNQSPKSSEILNELANHLQKEHVWNALEFFVDQGFITVNNKNIILRSNNTMVYEILNIIAQKSTFPSYYTLLKQPTVVIASDNLYFQRAGFFANASIITEPDKKVPSFIPPHYAKK